MTYCLYYLGVGVGDSGKVKPVRSLEGCLETGQENGETLSPLSRG